MDFITNFTELAQTLYFWQSWPTGPTLPGVDLVPIYPPGLIIIILCLLSPALARPKYDNKSELDEFQAEFGMRQCPGLI
jgi:hypothetical protein